MCACICPNVKVVLALYTVIPTLYADRGCLCSELVLLVCGFVISYEHKEGGKVLTLQAQVKKQKSTNIGED